MRLYHKLVQGHTSVDVQDSLMLFPWQHIVLGSVFEAKITSEPKLHVVVVSKAYVNFIPAQIAKQLCYFFPTPSGGTVVLWLVCSFPDHTVSVRALAGDALRFVLGQDTLTVPLST